MYPIKTGSRDTVILYKDSQNITNDRKHLTGRFTHVRTLWTVECIAVYWFLLKEVSEIGNFLLRLPVKYVEKRMWSKWLNLAIWSNFEHPEFFWYAMNSFKIWFLGLFSAVVFKDEKTQMFEKMEIDWMMLRKACCKKENL